MRTMLLSFKASAYKKLVLGQKIYEHRKVFPNEPIKAYLYVSAPIKSVIGIIHLDNRVQIESWLDKYSFDKLAQERIKEYLETQKFAMEIRDFQNTNGIHLYDLRENVPGFIVPQMYYYIDDTPLLTYLRQNLLPDGKLIEHNFEEISSDQICLK